MQWKFSRFKFNFPSAKRNTLVMGILNLTPDSFSSDGLGRSPQRALRQAERMEAEGADLLDLGAESTRPGSRSISETAELKRLIPVLRLIRKKTKLPLSVDTQKLAVARAALEEGADIINDVSCLKDPRLACLIRKHKAGYILMHSRGDSRTMGRMNRYRNLAREVTGELRSALKRLEALGVSPSAIAIDPGIGFAKRGLQNLKLLQSIEQIQKLGYPICLGLSRKSFIGELTGEALPAERDFAVTALHGLLIERGIQILRVHSVKAARAAVLMTQAFLNA